MTTPPAGAPKIIPFNESLADRLSNREFALAYLAEQDAALSRQAEARALLLNAKGIIGLRARFDTDPKYLANGHGEVAQEMREAVAKIDAALAMLSAPKAQEKKE